jgi:hypothetical protein
MSLDAFIERKVKAQQAARLAAYGSVAAHTPADYTLQEALDAMTREKPKKDKKGDEQPVDEAALGPMFEEVSDD